MSQIELDRFERLWQIQRRTFVDGKYVNTEILAETKGGFAYAQKLFRDLTGIEPKDVYWPVFTVMHELGDDGKDYLGQYAEACKIAFNRNFTSVPFENGKGCFAYGIKRVIRPKNFINDEG